MSVWDISQHLPPKQRYWKARVNMMPHCVSARRQECLVWAPLSWLHPLSAPHRLCCFLLFNRNALIWEKRLAGHEPHLMPHGQRGRHAISICLSVWCLYFTTMTFHLRLWNHAHGGMNLGKLDGRIAEVRACWGYTVNLFRKAKAKFIFLFRRSPFT